MTGRGGFGTVRSRPRTAVVSTEPIRTKTGFMDSSGTMRPVVTVPCFLLCQRAMPTTSATKNTAAHAMATYIISEKDDDDGDVGAAAKAEVGDVIDGGPVTAVVDDVGAAVGKALGTTASADVGKAVGTIVGNAEGVAVGDVIGDAEVDAEAALVGALDRVALGASVGFTAGAKDGEAVGATVGATVGVAVE